MTTLINGILLGMIILIGMMLYRVIKGPTIYDRLNGIFAICTDTIMIIILVGFGEGRPDMYVDIALSYAVLGFISSVVIAKFVGVKKR
ncbi:MAG: monovalent cation/H+ antiporter complex subunit F [Anaerovoracaceae bacterium]